MNCEFCKRNIGHYEIAHGLQYGTIKGYPEEFVPAQDSAWTVICKACSEMLLKLIYAKLDNTSNNYTLHKTFTRSR